MVVANGVIRSPSSMSGPSASGSGRDGSLLIEVDDERDVDDDAVDPSNDNRVVGVGSIISGTIIVLGPGIASLTPLEGGADCFLTFFVLPEFALVNSLIGSFPRLLLSFDLELFEALVIPLTSAVFV
jgi:hypothetical protein